MLENLRKAGCGGQGAGADLRKELGEVDQAIREYENETLPCMPSVFAICEELERQQKGWACVYAEWYRYFSRAVHLDMGLIAQMVQPSGNQILCFADPPEYDSPTLLHYCLTMACDINHMVRRHYGWDPDDMQHEYESLGQKIDEMKKDNAM